VMTIFTTSVGSSDRIVCEMVRGRYYIVWGIEPLNNDGMNSDSQDSSSCANLQVGKVDSSTPARLPRWGPRPDPASSLKATQHRLGNEVRPFCEHERESSFGK
jgi:hypothetical protein